MKVLFIGSGNSRGNIGQLVLKQGKSLEKAGLEIDYFPITGKGSVGYLRNIPSIRKKIRSSDCDLVHAHYSLSGFAAALAFGGKPLVVSLMGSDIKMGTFWKWMIRVFSKFFWSATIVKSERMKREVGLRSAIVIPNGVDLELFCPADKNGSRKTLGFAETDKIILFAGDPERPEKNYRLLEEALKHVQIPDIKIQVLKNIRHEDIPVYMNAADVLALTSLWEGSPNVVKEALACNLPVVSTDVGDVTLMLVGLSDCRIASFEAEDFAARMNEALLSENISQKRQRIIDHKLDTSTIAERVEKVYLAVLSRA